MKAATHTLRLLYECKDLLSQGSITLPRPEREFLVRVRTGRYLADRVLVMAQELFWNARGPRELQFYRRE